MYFLYYNKNFYIYISTLYQKNNILYYYNYNIYTFVKIIAFYGYIMDF